MTRKQYRAAFSKLQPSQESVDRLLAFSRQTQPKSGAPIRWASLLAAATLAALLLGGTVYAITNWFRLTEAPSLTEPSLKEVDGPVQPTAQPEPQNGIQLEDPGERNYVCFALENYSTQDENPMETRTLREFLRWSGLPEPGDFTPRELDACYVRYFAQTPDGALLCAELLDSGGLGYPQYFTRYETELVKQGDLHGLEATWLKIREPGLGDTFHLFCHDETLGCTLVISSNRGFEACEALARALRLRDTGLPIPRAETRTVFGLPRAELPEGLIYWENTSLEQELLNARLADPGQDLSALWSSQILSRNDGSSISITARESPMDYSRVESCSLEREGELDGHPARWYREANYRDPELTPGEPDTVLVLWFEDPGCQVELRANLTELRLHPGELEAVAALLRPVAVVLTEEAPVEFHGLSVG